ncbi:MAG: hypothetical protein HC817_12475 [Saprospiraceae bacterium]|nr:hypothetical protein [Saprospiraceae bacterium]
MARFSKLRNSRNKIGRGAIRTSGKAFHEYQFVALLRIGGNEMSNIFIADFKMRGCWIINRLVGQ